MDIEFYIVAVVFFTIVYCVFTLQENPPPAKKPAEPRPLRAR